MVTEPPLMLYDSPTAGLDPITANTIIALIVKGRDTRNTTSMIVTHRYQDGQSGRELPLQSAEWGIGTGSAREAVCTKTLLSWCFAGSAGF